MQSITTILSWIAMLFPALPLGLGILRWRQLGRGQQRTMALMVVILGTAAVAEWLAAHAGSNLLVWHCYVVVELGFYFWIYASEVRWVRSFYLRTSIVAIVFVFAIVNALWIDGIHNFPSTTIAVKSILEAALAIVYFRQVFQDMRIWLVEREFAFWLSLGTLVLNLGSLMVNVFYELILPNVAEYYSILAISSSINILAYTLFAIAMICKTTEAIS